MLSLPLIVILVTLALAALILWRLRARPEDASSRTPAAPGAAPAVGATAAEAFDPEATRLFLKAPSKAPPVRSSAPAVTLSNPRLVGLSGDHRSLHFPIASNGLTVGRGPTNDIQLTDRRVSSSHAWIGLIAGRAVLRDLKSTNGTFLNTAIDAPVRETVLHPNDTVLFGGHGGAQFRFVAD